MEERITQVQAEEQCRLLRLKRNTATQQADTVYQKTMQSLFDNYTEELKRLDEKIVTYRYKITTLRTEMAEAWDKAVSEGKDEVRGSMGILMAPFKEKINTYQTKLESVRNERKYLSEHYAHNKRVASVFVMLLSVKRRRPTTPTVCSSWPRSRPNSRSIGGKSMKN